MMLLDIVPLFIKFYNTSIVIKRAHVKKGLIMNRKKAILYLIITSILWSIGGLFIKLIDLNPIAISGYRSLIAGLFMLAYLGKSVQVKPRGTYKLLGACSYACLVILFVTANKMTTSANAILLQFTSPIWIALFSKWFLKKSIALVDWLLIMIIMFGMALFFMGDLNMGSMLGNIIAVLSGVAMASMVTCLKLQKQGSAVEVTLLGNFLVFIIAIPFILTKVANVQSIIGLLILGIFQLGISYILFTAAITHVSALEAILIPIIEPLLNPVWVYFVTGEQVSIYSFIGGMIILSSVVFRTIHKERNEKKNKSLQEI